MPPIATITINSRRSRTQIIVDVKNVAQSLQGSSLSHRQLVSLFAASYAQSYYHWVNTAYNIKANGGTDDLGNRWPPLAPSTLKKKKKNLNKILIEFQDLEKTTRPGKISNWTYRPYIRNQIYNFNGRRLTLGSKDPKTKFHQKGTIRMPARPLFPRNDHRWVVRSVIKATTNLRDALAIFLTS